MSDLLASNEMKARSLSAHVRIKLVKSLEKWSGSSNEKEALASAIVTGLERDLEDSVRPDSSERLRNRVYVDACNTIAKAFSIHPNSANRLLDGSMTVSSVVRSWSRGRQDARKVYEDITVHHQRLMDASTKSSEHTKNAAEVTTSSFDAYADAAKSMGDRVWVAEANRYMFNYCVNFFRFGGHRKLFMRHWVAQGKLSGGGSLNTGPGAGKEPLCERKEPLCERILHHRTSFEVFSRDLCRFREDKRVRVLDVGSCYNPFEALDRALHLGEESQAVGAGESFNVGDPNPLAARDGEPVEKTADRFVDVTALDLHPATPASVFQCDFLALRVGEEGSAPEVHGATPGVLGSIAALPAHSYDALTMCLVLCYLPSPAQRLAMITKARRLLRNPLPQEVAAVALSLPMEFPGEVADDAELKTVLQQYYSDSGLLVIAEKESIVGSAKANSANATRVRPYPSAPPVTELLPHWKATISQVGFECIRYHNVVCTADKHKYHLFVFKTVATEAPVAPAGLFIRQDYGNTCAPDTASVSSSESTIRATIAEVKSTEDEIEAHAVSAVTGGDNVTASCTVFGGEPSIIREFVLDKPEIKKMIERDNKAKEAAAVRVANSDADESARRMGAFIAPSAHTPRVGIIGAGIGGLTLGFCLQQLGIPYRIFERDAHVSSRRQGYGLTLQQANGVLQSLDLYKHIQAGETGGVGVVSTSNASYNHTGELLGAYGVDVEAYAQESGLLERRPEFNNSALQRGADSSSDGESQSNSESEGEGESRGTYNQEVNRHNKRGRAAQRGDSGPRQRRKTGVLRQNHHIPRQVLREMLLTNTESCKDPVGGISWSKVLVGLKCGEAGKVHLSFKDGSEDSVDVLVGADGIFSSVRDQLDMKLPVDSSLRRVHNITSVRDQLDMKLPVDSSLRRVHNITSNSPLRYLGLMVILGISPGFDKCAEDDVAGGEVLVPGISHRRSQHQWLDGRPGDSSSLGSHCRVFTMPYDATRTMWQVSFVTDEESASRCSSASGRTGAQTGSDASVGGALKQLVLDLVEGWPTPLRNIINSTPADVVTGYPIYDRDPPEPSHPASTSEDLSASSTSDDIFSRCVLIGDAAHPMSPFKGQGANQAVIDARLLATALGTHATQEDPSIGISKVLREFERNMYARATTKVLKSRAAAEFLHSPLGLRAGNITRAAAAAGMKSPFEDSSS